MNATTTTEAAALDLEPVEQPAAPIVAQQGGALAANSPAAMMMQAMAQGADLTQIEKMMDRIKRELDIYEWFNYDPETGLVTWKKKPNRNIRIGDVAGFDWVSGRNTYTRISLQGKYIFAHHAALVIATDHLPVGVVDHIDGDGRNNKLENLRDVSHTENLRNQRLNSKNSSGVMGVDYLPQCQRWRARIIVDKKEKHLGLFATKAEAVEARELAQSTYGFHMNHGRVK